MAEICTCPRFYACPGYLQREATSEGKTEVIYPGRPTMGVRKRSHCQRQATNDGQREVMYIGRKTAVTSNYNRLDDNVFKVKSQRAHDVKMTSY